MEITLIILVTIALMVVAIIAVVTVTRKDEVIRRLQRELQHAKKEETTTKYAAYKLIAERDLLRDRVKRLQKDAQPAPSAFTRDQFNTLIQLCHPDKHGGKQSAVDITTVLLQRRPKT